MILIKDCISTRMKIYPLQRTKKVDGMMQYDICFRELFAWNNSLLSSYFHSSIITKEKALLVLDQLVLHNGCPQSQTEHLASFSLHTLWLLFPLINLIQLISCCRGWRKMGINQSGGTEPGLSSFFSGPIQCHKNMKCPLQQVGKMPYLLTSP